ncbi:unnamed protein product [Xylocopa violacea]
MDKDVKQNDFQNHRTTLNALTKVGSSEVAISNESSNSRLNKETMDVEELNQNEFLFSYLSSNDSDTDLDNIQYESSGKMSKSESSSSINVEIDLYNDTFEDDCSYDAIDVGILEEHNSDPNNNLDSIQKSEKQSKSITLFPNDTYILKSAKSSNTSLSDYVDNFQANSLNAQVKKEAAQISTLLPKLKYEHVLNVLYKNRYAENRIELSLWDLLPKKRPLVKQKYTNNNPVRHRKVFVGDDLLAQQKDMVLLSGPSKSNVMNPTNRKNALRGKHKINTLSEDSKNSKAVQNIKNDIICPAKLIVDNKHSHQLQHVTSTNVSILTPSKLTYVTAKQYGNNINTEVSKIQKTSNSSSFGRNVFMQTSQDNNNNSEGKILENYMNYFNCMQNIKKQKLCGTLEHFGFSQRNMIREKCLKSQSMNKDILHFSRHRKKTVDSLHSNKSNTTTKVQSTLQNTLSHKSQCLNVTLPENCATIVAITDSNTLFQADLNTKLTSTTTINSSVSSTESVSDNKEIILNMLPSEIGLNDITNSNIDSVQDKSMIADYEISSKSINLPSTSNQVLSEPSTSTVNYPVQSVEQVIAGTKRKVITTGKKVLKDKTNTGSKAITSYPNIQQICEELLLLFPETNEDYIRQICREHWNRKGVSHHDLLEELIQLISKNTGPNLVDMCQENATQKDEKYTALLNIFPNADPMYMEKVVAQLNDPNMLEDYINTQWKNPTYLTKEEKLRKIQITEQQMQYTSKFNIKHFLEVFPDPFTHFKNPNRKCIFKFDALEFLKFHFNKLEVATVIDMYEQHNYNLTLTACALENIKSDRISNPSVSLWEKNLSNDIPLLQECAFVKHKKKIKEYQNKLRSQETKEFEILKKRNEFLECQCCYNNECMPSKCSTCDDGHIFCNSCIVKGTLVKLAQGDTRASCFLDCDGEFSLRTLQKVLTPTQFSAFMHKKQEAEVKAAGLEGLVSCPFCHFASVPPSEDKVFKCLNPECMKETCRLCKELNHVPLKCYEEKSDNARRFVEEKMTEALVRKCYNCDRPYIKVDGCNKITCTCGAIMCYLCDKKITGYDHFKSQGSTCSLWSNNDLINTATVHAVAKQVAKHIKEKNPNVNINEKDFLKGLQNTSDASAIPERVQKVIQFDT